MECPEWAKMKAALGLPRPGEGGVNGKRVLMDMEFKFEHVLKLFMVMLAQLYECTENHLNRCTL